MAKLRWQSSQTIIGLDRDGRSLPVTVGLIETKAGSIECGIKVGARGITALLTVQTVGDLVSTLHRAKVERLRHGDEMLNDKELAERLAQIEKEDARDTFAALLLALTIPIADGKAIGPTTKDDYSRELTINGLSTLREILPEFCEQATCGSFEGDEWDEWAGLAERLIVLARACRAQVVDVVDEARTKTSSRDN